MRSQLPLLSSRLMLICLLCISAGTTAQEQIHLSPDTVIASLGSANLRVIDVDASVNHVEAGYVAGFLGNPERLGSHLETLLVRRAIVEKAKSQGKFTKQDLEHARQQAEDAVLKARLFEYYRNRVPGRDYAAMALDYYQSHADEFAVPEAVDVSHILIDTKSRSVEQARQRAQEALTLARQEDSDFQALALGYSDDPSVKYNSGNLGKVSRGQMVSPFEQAAFAIQSPGEIVGPVESQYGFHLIRLNQKVPPSKRSFAQVKDSLVQRFREDDHTQRTAQAREALVAAEKANQLPELTLSALDQARIQLGIEEILLKRYKAHYLAQQAPANYDDLAYEYYLAHPEYYVVPERRTFQRISILATNRSLEDAKALADEAYERAIAGEDFTDLVLAYSDDPRRAEHQGVAKDIGMVSDLGPVGKLAFKLPAVDAISEPLQHETSYHLVKLLAIEPAAKKPFEQVAVAIVDRLRTRHEKRIWDFHVAQFRQLPLNADPDTVLALRKRFENYSDA